MITDPDGVEGELLGGVRQAHERLGGINITQIAQANAKLHTVSSLPDARTMAALTRPCGFFMYNTTHRLHQTVEAAFLLPWAGMAVGALDCIALACPC